MKLTPEQIQQLYKFTRQHYVEYYDVQTELVDHLANDIEQIWQEQPKLSFEDARTISFKKFGVFGFMDVVGDRQKAMSKKYQKLLWSFAKDWFKLPKMILTALIFIIIYTGISSNYGKYFMYAVLLLMIIFSGYKGYFIHKQFKNKIKQTNKKWMLEEMIFKTGFGGITMLLVNFFNIFNLTSYNSFHNSLVLKPIWFTLGCSLFFTLLIIFLYVAIEVLPKKAEEILENQYPEYKLV
jgi:hypothetical protein